MSQFEIMDLRFSKSRLVNRGASLMCGHKCSELIRFAPVTTPLSVFRSCRRKVLMNS